MHVREVCLVPRGQKRFAPELAEYGKAGSWDELCIFYFIRTRVQEYIGTKIHFFVKLSRRVSCSQDTET